MGSSSSLHLFVQGDHGPFPKVWINPKISACPPRRENEAGDEAEGLTRASPTTSPENLFRSTLQRGANKDSNWDVPNPEGNLEQDAPKIGLRTSDCFPNCFHGPEPIYHETWMVVVLSASKSDGNSEKTRPNKLTKLFLLVLLGEGGEHPEQPQHGQPMAFQPECPPCWPSFLVEEMK